MRFCIPAMISARYDVALSERLGRQKLEKEAANWNRLSAAISRVVKLKEA
jgi:hypothetical protein